MEKKVDIFTTYKNWLKNQVRYSGRMGEEFDKILEYLYKAYPRFSKDNDKDLKFLSKIINISKHRFLDIWDATIEHVNDPQRKDFLENEDINWLEYYYSIAEWIKGGVGKLNTYHGDIHNDRSIWFWIMMDHIEYDYFSDVFRPFIWNDPDNYADGFSPNSGLIERICMWIVLDPFKHTKNEVDPFEYYMRIKMKIGNNSYKFD